MTSKLEREWRNFINTFLPKLKFLYNARPSFLVNPITKENLELDLYSSKYFLAIEIDGSQHHKFTKKYHKNVKEFNYQKERDKIKDEFLKDIV